MTAIMCSASEDSRRCREDATNVLQYDSDGFKRFSVRPAKGRQQYDHPLCDRHSDPAFHLRDLSAPNWRLSPLDNGSERA